jgi:hypothetical protein
MSPLVVAILLALVLALAWGAVHRCGAEIAAARDRARRTAEVAGVLGQARERWDRGTAAMEAALVPLFARPGGRAGFGDAEIESELLRRALDAPALVEMEER